MNSNRQMGMGVIVMDRDNLKLFHFNQIPTQYYHHHLHNPNIQMNNIIKNNSNSSKNIHQQINLIYPAPQIKIK